MEEKFTSKKLQPFFAPQLFIPAGITDISFYAKAFNASETKQVRNEDGTVHVVELSVEGAIFQLHEANVVKGQIEPNKANGVTALIGLFVQDVDSVIAKALAAGAILLSPAQDYDYGYRQATIKDPFGHHWMIEMEINHAS